MRRVALVLGLVLSFTDASVARADDSTELARVAASRAELADAQAHLGARHYVGPAIHVGLGAVASVIGAVGVALGDRTCGRFSVGCVSGIPETVSHALLGAGVPTLLGGLVWLIAIDVHLAPYRRRAAEAQRALTLTLQPRLGGLVARISIPW